MSVYSSYGVKGTESAAIFTNDTYRPVGTKVGVVGCHGFNGQGKFAVASPDAISVEMANRGYPVIYPDLALNAWGNDAAQAKVTDAITYLHNTLGAKAGPVLLFGVSMGALTSLNYMRNNPANVLGLALVTPMVSLATAFANSLFTTSINNAYPAGTYPPSGYASARASHNPMENLPSYTRWVGKIKTWYSSDDPFIPIPDVTSFGDAVPARIVSQGPQGHIVAPTSVSAIADFLESLVK